MTRNSTRTIRKASTARKPARVPAQAPAPALEAEEGRADIYQRITDRIAAAIEAGAGTWQMPWHPGADGAAPRLPVNAATGKPYRGINTVVLWATAQAEGYPSAAWATYRQWAELGAQVRKGEQSSPVVFWKVNSLDGRGRRHGWRRGRWRRCRGGLRIPTDPSRAFRRKPAGDSDRSQPPVPRHPSHP